MKYIKTYENKKDKIYLVKDVNENSKETKHFAFYDIESRDNFIVNYIHRVYKEMFEKDYYDDIKDKFTVDELLKEYNIEESYIVLETIDILENIKLDANLKLNKNTNKYNL